MQKLNHFAKRWHDCAKFSAESPVLLFAGLPSMGAVLIANLLGMTALWFVSYDGVPRMPITQ